MITFIPKHFDIVLKLLYKELIYSCCDEFSIIGRFDCMYVRINDAMYMFEINILAKDVLTAILQREALPK